MSGWAERGYGVVLRLLPAELRREFGADMAATFAARVADARRDGRLARCVARELAGLLVLAVTERLARRDGALAVRAAGAPVDAAAARPDADFRRKGLGPMEHVTRELRYAARRLVRTPGFTAAAVLTLALALAANVTIFTLVQRIVLAPLPYPAQERLVALEHAAPGAGVPGGMGISTGLYREYGAVPALEAQAMYYVAEGTVIGAGAPERLRYVAATPSLAEVLGARPVLGRWFEAAEAAPDGGGAAVMVLAHEQWVTRYGADPGVLGATLRLDGVVREIIGVLPPGFAFPDPRVQALIPLPYDAAAASAGGFNAASVARLREGATLDDLRAQLGAVIAQLPARFPADAAMVRSIVEDAGLVATPVLLRARVLGSAPQRLWVLLGAAAIVLLIACANLGNLFLVRMEARRRELAVRRALGASIRRILGAHLAEALLVALASVGLGVLAAHGAVTALVRHASDVLPRLHEVGIGGVQLGYALGLALAVGFGFGVLPLVRALAPAGGAGIDGARGSAAGPADRRGRELLVLAQVALAVVLLVGAALMIQSFRQLQRVDPGFRTERALAFRLDLPPRDYTGRDAAAAFHERLLERLRALPGVEAAAFTTTLPLDGDGWGDPLEVRGAHDAGTAIRPVARYRRVSPDYFAAMGIPLRAGRLLNADDALGGSDHAVIDEALAQLYFPGEDPLGRQVRPLGQEGDGWFTVVGVVGGTTTYGLAQAEPTAQIYFPHRTGLAGGTPGVHAVSYIVRTTGSEPLALLPAVRRALGELDPQLALARAETLAAKHARASAATAFLMLLLVTASLVALTLGLVGVYAVISYAVAQRTPEIGLRLALGARPTQVTRMVLRESGRVIAGGITLGLAAAAMGAHALQGLVFGVAPRDPATYAIVALGLFAVALLACWVPAQRAARISPLRSLQG